MSALGISDEMRALVDELNEVLAKHNASITVGCCNAPTLQLRRGGQVEQLDHFDQHMDRLRETDHG